MPVHPGIVYFQAAWRGYVTRTQLKAQWELSELSGSFQQEAEPEEDPEEEFDDEPVEESDEDTEDEEEAWEMYVTAANKIQRWYRCVIARRTAEKKLLALTADPGKQTTYMKSVAACDRQLEQSSGLRVQPPTEHRAQAPPEVDEDEVSMKPNVAQRRPSLISPKNYETSEMGDFLRQLNSEVNDLRNLEVTIVEKNEEIEQSLAEQTRYKETELQTRVAKAKLGWSEASERTTIEETEAEKYKTLFDKAKQSKDQALFKRLKREEIGRQVEQLDIVAQQKQVQDELHAMDRLDLEDLETSTRKTLEFQCLRETQQEAANMKRRLRGIADHFQDETALGKEREAKIAEAEREEAERKATLDTLLNTKLQELSKDDSQTQEYLATIAEHLKDIQDVEAQARDILDSGCDVAYMNLESAEESERMDIEMHAELEQHKSELLAAQQQAMEIQQKKSSQNAPDHREPLGTFLDTTPKDLVSVEKADIPAPESRIDQSETAPPKSDSTEVAESREVEDVPDVREDANESTEVAGVGEVAQATEGSEVAEVTKGAMTREMVSETEQGVSTERRDITPGAEVPEVAEAPDVAGGSEERREISAGEMVSETDKEISVERRESSPGATSNKVKNPGEALRALGRAATPTSFPCLDTLVRLYDAPSVVKNPGEALRALGRAATPTSFPCLDILVRLYDAHSVKKEDRPEILTITPQLDGPEVQVEADLHEKQEGDLEGGMFSPVTKGKINWRGLTKLAEVSSFRMKLQGELLRIVTWEDHGSDSDAESNFVLSTDSSAAIRISSAGSMASLFKQMEEWSNDSDGRDISSADSVFRKLDSASSNHPKNKGSRQPSASRQKQGLPPTAPLQPKVIQASVEPDLFKELDAAFSPDVAEGEASTPMVEKLGGLTFLLSIDDSSKDASMSPIHLLIAAADEEKMEASKKQQTEVRRLPNVKISQSDVDAEWQKLVDAVLAIVDEGKRRHLGELINTAADLFSSTEFLDKQAEAFLEAAGIDRQLQLREFVPLIEASLVADMGYTLSRDEIQQAFAAFDGNDNGDLDIIEYQVLLSYIALNKSKTIFENKSASYQSTESASPEVPEVQAEKQVLPKSLEPLEETTVQPIETLWKASSPDFQAVGSVYNIFKGGPKSEGLSESGLPQETTEPNVESPEAVEAPMTEEAADKVPEGVGAVERAEVSVEEVAADPSKTAEATPEVAADVPEASEPAVVAAGSSDTAETALAVTTEAPKTSEVETAEATREVAADVPEASEPVEVAAEPSKTAEATLEVTAGAPEPDTTQVSEITEAKESESKPEPKAIPARNSKKMSQEEVDDGWGKLFDDVEAIEDAAKRAIVAGGIANVSQQFVSPEFLEEQNQVFIRQAGPDRLLQFNEFLPVLRSTLDEAVEQAMGHSVSLEEIQQAFGQFDLDGSGALDPNEYQVYLSYLALQICIRVASETGASYQPLKPEPEPEMTLWVKPLPPQPKKMGQKEVDAQWQKLVNDVEAIDNTLKREHLAGLIDKAAEQFLSKEFLRDQSRLFIAQAGNDKVLQLEEFMPTVKLTLGRVVARQVRPDKIHEAFNQFDADGSRALDVEEYQIFLSYVALQLCRRIFEQGTHKITQDDIDEEWAKLVSDIKAIEDADKREHIAGLINYAARDFSSRDFLEEQSRMFTQQAGEDGILQLKEFLPVVQQTLGQSVGHRMTNKEIRKAFEQFDADSNAALDASEYQVFLSYVALQLCKRVFQNAKNSKKMHQKEVDKLWQQLVSDIKAIEDPAQCDHVAGFVDDAMKRFVSRESLAEQSKAFTQQAGDDRVLQVEEFAPLVLGALRQAVEHSLTKAQILGYFSDFDADDNGALDANEYQVFLSYCALKLSRKLFDDACAAYDKERARKQRQKQIDEKWHKLVDDINAIEDGGNRDYVAGLIDKAAKQFVSQEYLEEQSQLFIEQAGADGVLQLHEFMSILESTLSEALGQKPTEAEVHTAFNEFDANGSGALDAREYQGFLAYVALQVCQKTFEEAIASYQAPKSEEVETVDIQPGLVGSKKMRQGEVDDLWRELVRDIQAIEDETRRKLVSALLDQAVQDFMTSTYIQEQSKRFVLQAGEDRILQLHEFLPMVEETLGQALGDGKMSQDEIKQQFQNFNVDDNPALDVQEYQVFLSYVALKLCQRMLRESKETALGRKSKKLGQDNVEAQWQQLLADIQTIEKATKRKYIAGLIEQTAQRFVSKEYLHDLAKAFVEEAGANRLLELSEFMPILQKTLGEEMQHPITRDEILEWFDLFDLDGNGSLDIEEYQVFLSYVALQKCQLVFRDTMVSYQSRPPTPVPPKPSGYALGVLLSVAQPSENFTEIQCLKSMAPGMSWDQFTPTSDVGPTPSIPSTQEEVAPTCTLEPPGIALLRRVMKPNQNELCYLVGEVVIPFGYPLASYMWTPVPPPQPQPEQELTLQRSALPPPPTPPLSASTGSVEEPPSVPREAPNEYLQCLNHLGHPPHFLLDMVPVLLDIVEEEEVSRMTSLRLVESASTKPLSSIPILLELGEARRKKEYKSRHKALELLAEDPDPVPSICLLMEVGKTQKMNQMEVNLESLRILQGSLDLDYISLPALIEAGETSHMVDLERRKSCMRLLQDISLGPLPSVAALIEVGEGPPLGDEERMEMEVEKMLQVKPEIPDWLYIPEHKAPERWPLETLMVAGNENRMIAQDAPLLSLYRAATEQGRYAAKAEMMNFRREVAQPLYDLLKQAKRKKKMNGIRMVIDVMLEDRHDRNTREEEETRARAALAAVDEERKKFAALALDEIKADHIEKSRTAELAVGIQRLWRGHVARRLINQAKEVKHKKAVTLVKKHHINSAVWIAKDKERKAAKERLLALERKEELRAQQVQHKRETSPKPIKKRARNPSKTPTDEGPSNQDTAKTQGTAPQREPQLTAEAAAAKIQALWRGAAYRMWFESGQIILALAKAKRDKARGGPRNKFMKQKSPSSAPNPNLKATSSKPAPRPKPVSPQPSPVRKRPEPEPKPKEVPARDFARSYPGPDQKPRLTSDQPLPGKPSGRRQPRSQLSRSQRLDPLPSTQADVSLARLTELVGHKFEGSAIIPSIVRRTAAEAWATPPHSQENSLVETPSRLSQSTLPTLEPGWEPVRPRPPPTVTEPPSLAMAQAPPRLVPIGARRPMPSYAKATGMKKGVDHPKKGGDYPIPSKAACTSPPGGARSPTKASEVDVPHVDVLKFEIMSASPIVHEAARLAQSMGNPEALIRDDPC